MFTTRFTPWMRAASYTFRTPTMFVASRLSQLPAMVEAARCRTASTPSKAGMMPSRSAMSACVHGIPPPRDCGSGRSGRMSPETGQHDLPDSSAGAGDKHFFLIHCHFRVSDGV